MNKILVASILVLGLFSVSQPVLAQGEEGDGSATATGATLETAASLTVSGLGCLAGMNAMGVYGCQPGAEAAHAVAGQVVETGIAAVLSPVAAISWAIFMISAQLLGIAGAVFNFAMQYLVFDFGQFFGNSTGMLLAWGVLRDIGNILLIFGFIFMGIATILDLHNYSARKSLPRLIIFAVLLNFSLFTAEAVIDASNVFASTLYQQGFTAAQENCDSVEVAGTQGDVEGTCAIESGVSGSVLTAARMTTVFQEQDQGFLEGLTSYMDEPLPYILKFIGLALITTTAAIVLLAGAFMLIGRGVQLALLMVTSPIGFAGMAIPPLQKFAQDWWHRLISQALFAPVFLLLLLVALKVVEGLATLSNASGGLANAFSTNNALDIGPVFFYILIMAFLIMALMSAKKFGVWGAEFSVNAASALTFGALTRGTNLVAGGAAYGLRQGIQRSPLAGTGVGKVAVNRLLRPLEMANIDMRRLPGVSAALGAGGISSGAKPADHATLGDMGHIVSEAVDRKQSKTLERQYNKELKSGRLARNAHKGRVDDEDKKVIAGMTTKDLEGFHGLSEIAQYLSPDQYQKLQDSDKLTDLEKEKLADERFRELRETLAAGQVAAGATATPAQVAAQAKSEKLIRGLARADLENLPSSILANQQALESLSDKQRDDLLASKKTTSPQRDAIKNSSRHMRFEIEVNNRTGAARDAYINSEIGKLSGEQMAKLDVTILTNPTVAAMLPGSALRSIEKRGLSAQAMSAIAAEARRTGAAGNAYMNGPEGALW